MLIEFRVANHRSIRDEQALTMEAANIGAKDDPIPREVPGYAKKLLPAAAIYGANASGKSNVLSALQRMVSLVTFSHIGFRHLGSFRVPFAWGPATNLPSLFEVKLCISQTIYQYGFTLDDSAIVSEWLYAWPSNRKQLWYSRDHGEFKFGKKFFGSNHQIAALLRPDALYLSMADSLGHPLARPVGNWFRTATAIFRNPIYDELAARQVFKYLQNTKELSAHDSSEENFVDVRKRKLFIDLVRGADLGIERVEMEDGLSKISTFSQKLEKIRVVHRRKRSNASLSFIEESHGTQSLLLTAPYIINSLADGSLLIIDELESGLHPHMAMNLVQIYNNPKSNSKNAQIIFTTHDANLLGNFVSDSPLRLRRDQIWFTEKDQDGATILYPLTDFKIHNEVNLQRGYLHGRFGAVPFLDSHPVLKE